ncbi:hypothetical protein D6D28_02203 [Aureobasidium pullulans]|uniref:Uncharacterized protein n=1 Tax=Aureobasidium pullulans TaxID=5580 RepID=A0A4S8SUQ8_AURPU|nr:hypothetical protein D6D28_02203 [Aureobasidium pullulans]
MTMTTSSSSAPAAANPGEPIPLPAALRAQLRREFEEHMKRDNRPVTVMTSAGLVTLSFTEVEGNDAGRPQCLKPGCANNQYQGYLNEKSRNSHICTMVASSNGDDFERRSTWSKIPKNLETIRIVCSQISLLKTHILGAMRTSEEKRHLERYLLEQRLYYNQHSSDCIYSPSPRNDSIGTLSLACSESASQVWNAVLRSRWLLAPSSIDINYDGQPRAKKQRLRQLEGPYDDKLPIVFPESHDEAKMNHEDVGYYMQASVEEAARKINEAAGATVDNAVTQLDRSATAAFARMTAEFAPVAAEHWGMHDSSYN